MSGSVGTSLRDFFVNIAYRIDRTSETHFLNSLENATHQVAELYASVESAAAGIFEFTLKIATGLERMYYSSTRTGSSVQAMNSFAYAISQVGGTAAGAQQSLEGIAAFLRSTPAGETFFHGLGVATRDANGQFVGTEQIATQFAEKMARMPIQLAQARARAVGIDEQTFLAMRNNFGPYMAEYDDLVRRAGLNMGQASRDAVGFTREVRSLGITFDVLGIKVASTLEAKLGSMVRGFRERIVANMGLIADVVVKGAKVLIDLAELFNMLGVRAGLGLRAIIDWIRQLDPETRKWTEAVLLLVGGWLALNRAWRASPLGVLFALGALIYALVEDYQRWKTTGKSLIDWKQWEPGIVAASAAVVVIGSWMKGLAHNTNLAKDAFELFAVLIAGSWMTRVIRGFTGASASAGGLIGTLGRLSLMYAAWQAGKTIGEYLADIDEHPPEWVKAGRHWLGTDKQANDHPGIAYLLRSLGFDLGPNATPAFFATTGKAALDNSPATVGPGAMGMMQMLMKMGPWSLAQAAGIVANMQEESGLNYREWGDHGRSYGLFQTSQHQRDVIEAHFDKERGSHKAYTDYSAQEQVAGFNWSVMHGEETKAGTDMLATQDSDETARVMSTEYERSADPNKDPVLKYGDFTKRRIALAPLMEQTYYQQNRPGAMSAAEGNAPGAPVNVNTQTTIHVQAAPGQDPHSLGSVIARLNDQQNRQTLRNVASKTQ